MINKKRKMECRHGVDNIRMYNGGVICMKCRTPFNVLDLDTEITTENISDAIETIKLYNTNLTMIDILDLYRASIEELQNELFVAVLMEKERDNENHKDNLDKKPQKIRVEKMSAPGLLIDKNTGRVSAIKVYKDGCDNPGAYGRIIGDTPTIEELRKMINETPYFGIQLHY